MNMKKVIISVVFGLIFLFTTHNAYSFLNLTIYGGLSTPNDQMAMVYKQDATFKEFVNNGINLGWHLGARFRIPLDSGLLFVASLGWNRFPDAQLEAKYILDNKDKSTPINATQDIIPIGVGIQYYLTNKLLKVYLIGELNYNYFTSHGTFLGIDVPPLDLSQSANRMGLVGGIGFEINAGIVAPMLEFKYSFANLVGKETNEPNKTYFLLSLGF